MAKHDVDLFVIGAGSGGVRAARIAAGHGARVMIAEEFRVGGTCVIRGCVPKKLLVYASRFADDFEDAAGFGWTVLQFLGALLVTHELRHYQTLYGTFASFIVLVWWLGLGTLLAAYAAELDVVIQRHLWPRPLRRPRPAPADQLSTTTGVSD